MEWEATLSSGCRRVTRVVSLVLLMVALVGLGAEPAGATRDVRAGHVVGTYTLISDWDNGFHNTISLTLLRNHTGEDGELHTYFTWSRSGRNITIIVTGLVGTMQATITYLGTITHSGFNTQRRPGTMSVSVGGSGTWYAIKTS
jgi:hypothetical protein